MKKVALVTGGAHPMGIGYASAKALLALDFEVVVTGYSEEEITLTPMIEGLSTKVLDVTDEESIAALFENISQLDALVNCAGHATPHEFELDQFVHTLDINLTGTMRMCSAARPMLAVRGGVIVNVASMYAIFGSSVTPAYTASKSGVAGLTRSLAAAWAVENIRVNAVAPGWIKTNMARVLWEDPDASAPIVGRTPMARWGEPDELGDVIGFLCSPAARFVTGTMIPVDGGYSISG